jgi:hypothetical protein
MTDHLSSHEEEFHIFSFNSLFCFEDKNLESQCGNGKQLSRQTGQGESHTVLDLLVCPAAHRGKITPCIRRCLVSSEW